MSRNTLQKTPKTAHIWFWPHLKIGSAADCWPWTGAKQLNGYGRVRRVLGKPQMLAHRLSFFLMRGRWPEGVTRHTCDNKICCNPDHLIEGTIGDNARDAAERGLLPRGEQVPTAKLTAAQVAEIRNSTLPHKEWAKKLGVHDTTIMRARRRHTWAS